MKEDRIFFTVLLIYVLVGIFTFGHAMNHIKLKDDAERTCASGLSAIAWPLYWSVRLQEQ